MSRQRLIMERYDVPDSDIALLRIIEQTYRNKEFGNKGFFQGTNVNIRSNRYSREIEVDDTVCVRGDLENYDDDIIQCSKEFADRIEHDVRLFNKTFDVEDLSIEYNSGWKLVR